MIYNLERNEYIYEVCVLYNTYMYKLQNLYGLSLEMMEGKACMKKLALGVGYGKRSRSSVYFKKKKNRVRSPCYICNGLRAYTCASGVPSVAVYGTLKSMDNLIPWSIAI